MIKGIYGINIAVKDLAEATRRYENVFGVKAEPMQGPDFAFPGLLGAKLNINGVHISLITSTRDDTAVAKFLERRGEGVFLVSVEVDAIAKDIESLKSKGLDFLLKDVATGEFGAVNFVHPKLMNGVQFEIYQPGKK